MAECKAVADPAVVALRKAPAGCKTIRQNRSGAFGPLDMTYLSLATPNSRPLRHAIRLLPALGLLPLAACDDQQALFAPTCPPTEIVSEAADAFTYDGRGLDAGSLVDHASIQGLTGSCAQQGHQHVIRTRLSLTLRVTRGAAAKGDHLELPYFVVVMHNDRIVDKKIFSPAISLDPASDTSTVQTPVVSIDLPADRDQRADGYRLEVGFQLTHAQLDFNRSHLAPAGFKAE